MCPFTIIIDCIPAFKESDSSVECGTNYILYSVLLNIYLRNRVLCSFTH